MQVLFCASSNKAQVLFRTDGKNIRDNYATLYSAKAALSLLDFELPLEVEAEKRVLKTAGLEGLCVIGLTRRDVSQG